MKIINVASLSKLNTNHENNWFDITNGVKQNSVAAPVHKVVKKRK